MFAIIDLDYITPDDVRKAVADLEVIQGDNEIAHRHEDILHQTVLLNIARGTTFDPQSCAHEALKTVDLTFTRWYS